MHEFLRQARDSRKSFELPGAYPHYNPDRPGQVEHVFLDLDLDIPNQRCTGTCTIRLNPVRSGIESLELDAVEMEIGEIRVGKSVQTFEHDGTLLRVKLTQPTQAGKAIELAIAYTLDHPQRGLYFILPSEHYPDKPTQVWTQGEDEDSRFWFPCFDYPGQLATSEIRVRVPQPLYALSNGVLQERVQEKNTTVFHWQQEEIHPTYLMTLAVGDFAEIPAAVKIGDRSIPCPYYVEKGKETEAQLTLGKTPQMIAFFSEIFGYDYPFPKYAQACVTDFIFGGMENTSATLLTDRVLIDERAQLDSRRAETLVAHELAHQWFGDLLIIKHWSHAWLKEGMATYSESLWLAHEYGEEMGHYARLEAQREYLDEDTTRYRRPIVTHVYREAIELYDRHLYEKASCVYHMLRSMLGDELFWKAIHTFVKDNAHATIETIDLIRAIEKATGRNLMFLFDQYVFRGGHPDYKVAYSWDSDSSMVKLTVTQTQVGSELDGKDLFDLKIPVGFGYVENTIGKTIGKTVEGTIGKTAAAASKKKLNKKLETLTQSQIKTFSIRIHEREQSFYFPLEQKPDFVSFDVGNHHLKTVELAYPLAQLKMQLQQDSDPIARIYAAEAIAKQGSLEAVKALAAALQAEPFWAVRMEIAQALGKVQLDQVQDALLVGLQDESAHVRRAVVLALGKFKTKLSYQAVKAIAEKGDPAYTVEAAALRTLGVMAKTSIAGESKEKPVLKLLKAVLKERAGWNEVVRAGAIGALAQMKTSEAALELIFDYTTLGIPEALRLAAVRALGTISQGQSEANLERILNRLEEISREMMAFMTQMAVLGALGSMETGGAIAILRSLSESSPDGRVKQRAEEAIKRVQSKIGSDKAVKQLQLEMEQIKKDNQSLKSRLAELEAKAKQADVEAVPETTPETAV